MNVKEREQRPGEQRTLTVRAALVGHAAVAGRWVAVMLTAASLPTDDPAQACLVRVALHEAQWEAPAYPGDDLPDGVLYEIGRFFDESEVRLRWAQAQAVAELLNAAQA